MELKDFMNSKGLGMEVEIHVTHRRDNGIHTIKIAEMLEEYHQAKLKLLGIPDVVGRSEQLVCCENCTHFDKQEKTCSETCINWSAHNKAN